MKNKIVSVSIAGLAIIGFFLILGTAGNLELNQTSIYDSIKMFIIGLLFTVPACIKWRG